MASQGNLEELARAVHKWNQAGTEIAQIIGRPALDGHLAEYVAAEIFGIILERTANRKGVDGRFLNGPLAGKKVDIKWQGKMEGLLNISPHLLTDFYLVMSGARADPASSRGTTRPWIISSVFLFDANQLVRELQLRNVKVGEASSITKALWQSAEIYPEQRNRAFVVSEEQRRLLALFKEP